MRLRTLFLSLASVLTAVSIITAGVFIIRKIRWDKIPIVNICFLEIELWDSGFDASYLEEPIKWYQLDSEPADWEENGIGSWFSMNSYTKKLLKKYMKENNLGIVPGDWAEFKFRSNLEECLETFEFVSLGEPLSKAKTSEYIGYTVLGAAVCLAVLFWVLYFKSKPGNTGVCISS